MISNLVNKREPAYLVSILRILLVSTALIKWSDLLLYTWTVNDPEHAKLLVDWEVDAITTDRAQWLSAQPLGELIDQPLYLMPAEIKFK